MSTKDKKAAKKFKELERLVISKAKIKKGSSEDNIKLGSMGSWSALPGNIAWEIPELNVTVMGTCGGNCKGCFDSDNPKNSDCYVLKSYFRKTHRNEDGSIGDIVKNKCSIKLGHAYRTIAMTMFRKELLLSLDAQLTRMKEKLETIRINESGEFTCFEDFELWCELARRHPESVFYVYTKNYAAIRKAIELDIIPYNLFVNISIWHKFGIKQFLEFKEHPQIKAFVMLDDEWTVSKYKKFGINIETMCGAYDSKGKMNHECTCDICGKCFKSQFKVIGCFKH